MTILAVLLLGCEPDNYSYAGHDMVDHFPLDGQRKWVYSNAGTSWRMNVEKSRDVEVLDTTEIHTMEFWQADQNGVSSNLLMEMRVSSDTYDGVLIHSYEVLGEPIDWDTGAGDDTGDDTGVEGFGPAEVVDFDPPLVFAAKNMVPGEVVETTTGGSDWTGTLVSQEDCANHWVSGENTWQCLKVQLDDGDDDLNAGAKLSGSYWIAPRWGMSWFQMVGDPDTWILVRGEWEP
jgi:hypothetical protein